MIVVVFDFASSKDFEAILLTLSAFFENDSLKSSTELGISLPT